MARLVSRAGSGGVRRRTMVEEEVEVEVEVEKKGSTVRDTQDPKRRCGALPPPSKWNSPISTTCGTNGADGGHLYRRWFATTAGFWAGCCFLTTMLAPRMPSGEDTCLYNYGVPVIGRSKLRFPASREQEYAARARRAALREIWGFARDARSVFSINFHSINSCRCAMSACRARVVPVSRTPLSCAALPVNSRDLDGCIVMRTGKNFQSASFQLRGEITFFFGTCRLLNERSARPGECKSSSLRTGCISLLLTF